MIPHPSTIAETAFVARMDRMSDAEIEEIRADLPHLYAKWRVGHCEAAERLKKMADDAVRARAE